MTGQSLVAPPITAIIPTVGRADMLARCLASLVRQTVAPTEVIVVHCGADADTPRVVADPQWPAAGIAVRYVPLNQRNAAAQRNVGVTQASHDLLLFLDDDVELAPEFVAELLRPMQSSASVGATMGRAVNHPFGPIPLLWRGYRLLCARGAARFEPGRLIGAAVPNGFPGEPESPVAAEWLAGGLTLVTRAAFLSVGGFAPYFTGPAPGEDMDFGYRLSRRWRVLFVPAARAVHHQAGGGRSAPAEYHYEWVRGRFATVRRAMGRSRGAALWHAALWALFQTVSEVASLRKGWRSGLPAIWVGRWRAVASCAVWEPPLPVEQAA